MRRPNVLFVTLDQMRHDAMSCAGHPIVVTPTLDRLAAEGVRFANHWSQAAPCSPGRASLYTGLYQMTHRVMTNGTPLDDRFDNVARAARRAGYVPTLFGYTDQGIDPRTVDPSDPRLATYEGVLPGFAAELDLGAGALPYLAYLAGHGHHEPDLDTALDHEPERPEALSISAFLTDRLVEWIDRQDGPWFAHASYLRPHPPYAAAGAWATRYDPDALPDPLPVPAERHPLHDLLLAHPILRAPDSPTAMRALRAQYFGMVSEVDHQLGRVIEAIERRGEWDDTVVVVTADHGEQLGDQGMVQKAGFYDASFHIACIVRVPGRAGAGRTVDAFTENVDVFPTLCELMGIDVPAQCDGVALTPFLDGGAPERWRDAAVMEWDWRDGSIERHPDLPPSDRRYERHHLVVRRSAGRSYVHFGDGSWRCFDLAADPAYGTPVTDLDIVLAEAQALLGWQLTHADRTLTGTLLRERGVVGRRPIPRSALDVRAVG